MLHIFAALVALIGLAIASPLAPSITCDETNSGVVIFPACDSSCIHQFSYYTAYSSASSGVKLALDAFEAFDWCTVENKDWCPEAINTTVSGIAGNALTEAAVDFNNCDSNCMLTSLADISQMSALWVRIQTSPTAKHE